MPIGKMKRKADDKYVKVSCHTSKPDAEAAQKKMWAAGNTARIAKNESNELAKWCIYSVGARKKVTLKKTGQTILGPKRRKRVTRRRRRA